jgi:hypothetical protein
MALIFHQNMRNYGGGAPGRNVAYNGALGAINAITGALYWVAGFTEITNTVGSVAALLARAAVLDAGLTRIVVIEVGTTALGTREFIGIAWDNANFTVAHGGSVVKFAMNQNWVPHNVANAALGTGGNQTIALPGAGGLAADTRGLAYIAGTNAGNPYLIGFLHNMYALGNKTEMYQRIGGIADNARAAIGGVYAGAEVIIGGDFNVAPAPARKRPRGFTLDTVIASAMGAPINTTLANPYDYWKVSNPALNNGDASVYVQTRVALCSDHAAIVLTR